MVDGGRLKPDLTTAGITSALGWKGVRVYARKGSCRPGTKWGHTSHLNERRDDTFNVISLTK